MMRKRFKNVLSYSSGPVHVVHWRCDCFSLFVCVQYFVSKMIHSCCVLSPSLCLFNFPMLIRSRETHGKEESSIVDLICFSTKIIFNLHEEEANIFGRAWQICIFCIEGHKANDKSITVSLEARIRRTGKK